MTKRIFIRILYLFISLFICGLVFTGCFGERVREGDKSEAGLRPAPGSLVPNSTFANRLRLRRSIADRSRSILALSRTGKDGLTERYHPYGDLAMPVLGYLDGYGRGLDGIEYAYDRILLPADATDKKNHQEPLILSIDRRIQALSEKNLRWQIDRLKAKQGSQIIMDV
ncbi:MAG: hypothetical protein DSZ23_00055, partial [Thermodesulfatator sp.]